MRLMYIMQQTTEMLMAITVPTAEPITPRRQNFIRTRLKMMFKTEEKIRKYSGVLLSPSARINPESRLKATISTIASPRIMIKLYESS